MGGQACMLLNALVRKCGLSGTSQFRLLPRGSYSAIQHVGDVLELYSSDGGFARFFSGRRFDFAITAFLGLLKEVAQFLQKFDGGDGLPYGIEGDKVGSLSCGLQFNQDEKWTRALKFMLADL